MTSLADVVGRVSRSAEHAAMDMTIPTAEVLELLAAARVTLTYLAVVDAWSVFGRSSAPTTTVSQLGKRAQADLDRSHDQALTDYQTKNLAHADELRRYRQDHP